MPHIRRVLTAGVLTAAVMLGVAPAALAGPPPEPDPAPAPAPVDVGAPQLGTAGCQGGEVMRDGNCVPSMTPVGTTSGGGSEDHAPLRISDDESSSSTSGIGADLVPNINGTPCTGYWSSMACEEQTDDALPSVQPRSTLSDSP